jgi:hypothetical protein
VYERVAAIDVGKKIIAVAVRTPGEGAGTRGQAVRKFDTYCQTLVEMVAWLAGRGRHAGEYGSNRGVLATGPSRFV